MNVTSIAPRLNKQRLSGLVSTMASPSAPCGVRPLANPIPVNLIPADVSQLWLKLTALYGQLFISKHGVADDGVWFATLKDLTPKALVSGVERLMTLSPGDKFCDFPPNCLQFRALCLSFYSELGLPKVMDAYREIENRMYLTNVAWIHPAVEYTAAKLGSDFLNMTKINVKYDFL